MDLHDKVALVTGGAVRVGRAISLALANAGADLVLNYNSSAGAAEETATEIRARGRQALPFKANVTQSGEIAALVGATLDRFGRLDVLVNSASLWLRTPWNELTEEMWDQSLDVDLKGAFLCAKACAPHLAAHGDGVIVNIVDLSVYKPFPGYLPHSVAKAGLLNMTYALAMELAPAVRANAVAPGPVLPPPTYSAEQTEAVARRTLLGRWGSADDVAQAVLYLAQASYVTGVVLPVDGGERLGGRRKTE